MIYNKIPYGNAKCNSVVFGYRKTITRYLVKTLNHSLLHRECNGWQFDQVRPPV